MKNELKELVGLSRFYGKGKDFVIAGGGNTSCKDDKEIFVKASGTSLSGISKDGFIRLSRGKLDKISKNKYSSDPLKRETEVKDDLADAIIGKSNLRPSVETSLHNLIEYKYVIHTHPWIVNAILCSKNGQNEIKALFPESLFVKYTDPGYILFKKVEAELLEYKKKNGKSPNLLFLENHGIFVSSDDSSEIKELYIQLADKIGEKIMELPKDKALPVSLKVIEILPAIRILLSDDGLKTLRIRNNSLTDFYCDKANFKSAENAFTPDVVVYCKGKALYAGDAENPKKCISLFSKELEKYKKEQSYLPKVIFIKGIGMIAVEDNVVAADTVLDVFEDQLKIAWSTKSFGGPSAMNKSQVKFIDNWEVENYRRKISKGAEGDGRMNGKIAIVTGAAQGFGAGIADSLYREGANVVVADISKGKAKKAVKELNKIAGKNEAIFIQVDVSDSRSMEKLAQKTVEEFGGIDLFVSNAGVLIAGSLEDMDPGDFDFVTKINYNGYYYGVRAVAPVMKLQKEHKPDHFMDIIQINSKSGLAGSNKNFAYAGGKFGGIGLTQSFALELAEHNIKVNSVCPGNFFDGPLWSDPKQGLFAQYLRTGKVPGAKTIADVKEYYEGLAPLKRGVEVEDVMKAVYYLIDQCFETGQALPVTGGQVMLS